MSDNEKENPFYRNHLFTKKDIKRTMFNKWNKLWLWMFPTHVQLSGGHAFYFKTTPDGKIWLIKEEKIGGEYAHWAKLMYNNINSRSKIKIYHVGKGESREGEK